MAAAPSERLRQMLDGSAERLRAVALRLCRNEADAKDLVQDTWEKALGAMTRDPAQMLSEAWLTTVLHNTFIDQCRRKKREGGTVPLESLPLAAPEPEETRAWHTITPEQMSAAIAALPEEFGRVYSLFASGSSYVEIAERLGLQKATVGTRVSRARKRLRELLLGAREEDRT
jgi:RNA polymerase sigma-70 factor, ECF subfamily